MPKMAVFERSRRELSLDISVGVHILLVVEQSSLERQSGGRAKTPILKVTCKLSARQLSKVDGTKKGSLGASRVLFQHWSRRTMSRDFVFFSFLFFFFFLLMPFYCFSQFLQFLQNPNYRFVSSTSGLIFSITKSPLFIFFFRRQPKFDT